MQLKNSTTETPTQQPTLCALEFGGDSFSLFSTVKGGDVADALDVAAVLAEGVMQICTRLSDAVNEGELVNQAELRSVAMLGDVASALTRAAHRGMTRVGGQE